jgi:hypothetical protein
MKEITLNIPDSKLEFFLALIKEHGFEVKIETPIPEEHKSVVLERIKNSTPAEALKWQDARGSFTFYDTLHLK